VGFGRVGVPRSGTSGATEPGKALRAVFYSNGLKAMASTAASLREALCAFAPVSAASRSEATVEAPGFNPAMRAADYDGLQAGRWFGTGSTV
jgi:hypothetical protein